MNENPGAASRREIAKLYDVENFLEVLFSDRKLIVVPPEETRFIAVNHSAALLGTGNLHLLGNTQVQFGTVAEAGFGLRLFAGSDGFFNTGPYPNGAEVELAGQWAVLLTVKGCVAFHNVDDTSLIASCYSGACAYSTNFGTDTFAFDSGQQIELQLDATPVSVTEPTKIPQTDHLKYWKLLNLTLDRGNARASSTGQSADRGDAVRGEALPAQRNSLGPARSLAAGPAP